MEVLIWIFLLIAVMWVFQLYLAVKQSQRFTDQLKEIRTAGTTTSVGMGGYRYRGGRAFVALAHKDGIVTGARKMTGLSVFQGAKPFPEVEGRHIRDLAKGEGMEGLRFKLVEATKMSATTLLNQKSQT
jgi:DNA-binding transcriptional regulator of glucitol operon